MSEIERFANDEFDIELIPNGDTFIVMAAGLASGLGYGSARDMVRHIPEAEKGVELVPTPGGEQNAWHLTEAGFYRVLGQRQAARIKNQDVRDSVERFQSWVFGEVLPQLRKHGRYEVATVQPAAESLELAMRVIGLQDRVMALSASNDSLVAKVEELSPKAEGYDDLIAADGYLDMSTVAKILAPVTGIGRTRLLNQLRGMGIILQGSTLPEQKFIERGYFQVRTDIVNGKAVASTVVTPKGLRWLQAELRDERPTLARAPQSTVVQLPQQRQAGELA
jgi:anti-repressor protein